MRRTDPQIDVCADPDALAAQVADWLLALARAKRGAFSLCLSGGSTPKTLYHRLANAPYRDAFPWARTHLFWGDERFVPHDDDLSNFKMVREALLNYVPLPAENIHPVKTEGLDPKASAADYARTLQAFYGAETLDPARPLFDVNLLGLGEDGHTASLFPNTDVLEERAAWAAAVIGAKDEPRITLTYPVLESSANAAFLVAGAGKADILGKFLDGDAALPAAKLHPTGELRVFCDVAARKAA